MCGIFFYLGAKYNDDELKTYANKIKHRGPDSTTFKRINNKLFFGFHRLAINGLNPESDQPMTLDGIELICNGEIFNYKDLIKKYNLENIYKTGSDCEIILHLYKIMGMKLCKELDGEFAFALYDSNKDVLHIARDQLGIRGLFWDFNESMTEISVCSEMKGIVHINKVVQFPIGTYWCSENNEFVKFYDFVDKSGEFNDKSEDMIIDDIRDLFTKAVYKRLMSDRKLACLLSGGLDSTTVSAIVSHKLGPYNLNTYSIGLKGSVDLEFAKIAAAHFKTNHTTIELSNNEFLDAIEKTIEQIESYDTTSVRASVGNYLVSLYIKEHTDDTVIFCGDVSDEIFASYRGFYYATGNEDFHEENVKMLNNIQYFDVLRSDRSISGASLEGRVPFSDKDFLKYCMNIHPSMKRFSKIRMEKYLFRKAFEHLLPYELAWRVKVAFSDGVSNAERPWYEIIKEYMDTKYSDEEYESLKNKYTHNTPYDKESLYYREIFEKLYPNKSHVIPYFWKQPFMTNEDPSAWCVEKNKE